MAPYSNQQEYAKFLAKKCKDEGHGEGCHECKDPNCGCCPPGLVALYDENGKHEGCVTPNDAQTYKEATAKFCDEGYVALYNNSTVPPTFLGCVAEGEFAAAYEAVNGHVSVDPTDVEMIPATDEVAEGETLQLYARFTPLDTTNQAVTWSSSNAAAASISSNGVITGIGAGVTTIRVTSDEDPTIFQDRVVTVIP